MKKLLFILLLLMFTPLVSFGQQDIERFKIYDTTNSYISLMLDTMTGESWMVQIGLIDSDAVRIVINDYQYSYSEETAKQKYEDALKTWEDDPDEEEDKNWYKPTWEFYKNKMGVVGQYELYPTNNMYNFIMVDVINGETWQVQWNFDKEKRFAQRIY